MKFRCSIRGVGWGIRDEGAQGTDKVSRLESNFVV